MDKVKKLKNSKFNVCINYNNRSCIANTLTGSVIEMDQNEVNNFDNDLTSFSTDKLNKLHEAGLVVEEDLDEIALLRNSYFHYKYNKNLALITICPTLECNFACPYCYERREVGKMSAKVQKEVIRYIDELTNLGLKRIQLVWYGGEPLLYPEIIKRISLAVYEMCKKKEITFFNSMISNGYLINEDIVQMFKEICLSTIQITIDGNEEVHNSRRIHISGTETYKKICENIKYLEESRIFVKVRVNMDHSNWDQYNEVKKKFSEYKNVHCYPAFVTVEDTQSMTQREKCFSIKEYNKVYKSMLQQGIIQGNLLGLYDNGVCACSAEHEYSCVIDNKGYLYKCINDLGKLEYAYGSVIKELINNPVPIARYMGRDPFTEEECCDCPYIPLCYGKCVWEFKNKGVHLCPQIKFTFKDLVIRQYLK